MSNGAAPSDGEFELIRRYFTSQSVHHAATLLGIGDDCALLRCVDGSGLAITTDTMVAGVHFLPEVDPRDLGHKILAVNLSDLAAVGALPTWVTLCLTLPAAEPSWLEGFSAGFFALAQRYGVELIGGDTTRGPLSITVQAMGLIPAHQALRRSGAGVGDLIFVTGRLGSAGLGLKILTGEACFIDSEPVARLLRPEPRVAVGQALVGNATACIDVSDGFAADLGHILAASGAGAAIEWERLPLSLAVRQYVAETGDWRLPLVAGDDYELCFTLPERRLPDLEASSRDWDCSVHQVGVIEEQQGLRIRREGRLQDLPLSGYDHFNKGQQCAPKSRLPSTNS